MTGLRMFLSSMLRPPRIHLKPEFGQLNLEGVAASENQVIATSIPTRGALSQCSCVNSSTPASYDETRTAKDAKKNEDRIALLLRNVLDIRLRAHMNLLRLKAETSAGSRSNHSPFLRLEAKRACQ